jgi:dienelactone hydrolase
VQREVRIETDGDTILGDLAIPDEAAGTILFAHGSGSDRKSPRNRQVADALHDRGLATLLIDLLTADEKTVDARTRQFRFDIELLTGRVLDAADWLAGADEADDLPLGYYGSSTGAAACLVAEERGSHDVAAVVSRGGRVDMAGRALERVHAPVLMIVGERDPQVLGLNRDALDRLNDRSRLETVAGATHLFEEPGAMDEVARLTTEWFGRWLAGES